jgi:predicted DNA-binding mobile mystery protein A
MKLEILLKDSKYKSLERLPEWLATKESYASQIRSLRSILGMTQDQLAKRSLQAPRMIRRLESEAGDPQLSTLIKTAAGLECELVIRFVPKKPLASTLSQRAVKKATQIVAQSKGTAAIEEQQPQEKYVKHQIAEMARDLMDRRRSLLWDDET